MSSRTEDNLIICPPRASEDNGPSSIILGVTVSIRTHLLEVLGVFSGPAVPELQQYSSVLKIGHGPLHPPVTFSRGGHFPMMSAVHLITRLHPPEVELNSIGTLNPSMSDMSMKSLFMYWFRANSASVFGVFPYSRHSRSPPQSPVSQLPFPARRSGSWCGPDPRSCRTGSNVEGPRLAVVKLPPAARDGGGPHGAGAIVGDVEPSCVSECGAAD
ncbi:uncharacterized protein J3R85_011839 [Psidium guajava]|nr:uncharacterized protein J3R85_011839 [Psidium guajava]